MPFTWMPSAAVPANFNKGFRGEALNPYLPGNPMQGLSPYWLASAFDLARPGKRKIQLPRMTGDSRLVVDSGGWALKSETKGFEKITPEHVIAVQNMAADVAFALDPAPRFDRDLVNPAEMRARSRKQRENNKVFLELKRKDLTLLNCAHGGLASQFRDWISTVKVEGFSGWAIANDSLVDDLCLYRGAAILYREHPESRTQWLHLFKESSLSAIPAMAWLSRYFPTLTSDSTSWLQAYAPQYLCVKGAGALHEAKSWAGGRDPHRYGEERLPCSCWVCEKVKTYRDFYLMGHPENRIYPLRFHTIVAIKTVIDFWNERASGAENFEAFRKILVESYSSFGRRKQALRRLDYLECALNHGPEVADVLLWQ